MINGIVMIEHLGKPSTPNNGEGLETVPTGQDPSPPYQCWDTYYKMVFQPNYFLIFKWNMHENGGDSPIHFFLMLLLRHK